MANFVINTFTVTGPEERIQKMMDEAVLNQDGCLMLSSWWPYPKGSSDEYVRDFCLGNFGCKWDCEIEIEEREEGQIQMCVQTPWVEPEIFFELMSDRYSGLVFRNYALYYEEHRYTIAQYIDEQRVVIEEGVDEDEDD